jgi:Ran-binding protein 9/10
MKAIHMNHLKRAHGKYSDAPEDEMGAAEEWSNEHFLEEPRILEAHVVERIKAEGARAWSLEFRSDYCIYRDRWTGTIERSSQGLITVSSTASCKDVSLLSTIPLRAGQYKPIKGNFGAYYEVTILKMGTEANISIGRS